MKNPAQNTFAAAIMAIVAIIAITTVSIHEQRTTLSGQAITPPQIQEAVPKASIEQSTLDLLERNKRYHQAPDEQQLTQLKSLAQQRREELRALAKTNPSQVLAVAFDERIANQFPPQVQPYLERRETISGTLRTIHGEDFQGNSLVEYVLETQQERLQVHFAKQPGLLVPTQVQLQAVKIDDTAVADDVGTITAQTTAAAPGGSTLAVVLVKFQDTVGEPFSVAEVQALMSGAEPSLRGYYLENSYGKTDLQITVQGWYTISYNNVGCSWSSWAEAARRMSGARANYVQYVFAPNNCGWAGLAEVGGTESYINGKPYVKTSGHELGHNFGINHANSIECFDSGSRVPISNNCTAWEYGDNFDIMGTAGHYHMNAPHKEDLGYLSNSNIATTSSGTYNIYPIEFPTTGIQAVRIPLPNSEYYYLEYRQPSVYDSFGAFLQTATQGVSIRKSQGTDTYSYIVDATAHTNTFNDAQLLPGQTFTDAAKGVSVTVLAANPSYATVSISTPPTTCVRGTPRLEIYPSSEWALPGESITYTATVTNTDNSACGSSAFTFSHTLPAGWTQSVPPAVIPPYGTAQIPIQVTAPLGTTPGFYPITETLDGRGVFTQIQFNVADPTIDRTPPVVEIIYPRQGQTVRGAYTILAEASDDKGVSYVQINANANPTVDATAPYEFVWDTRALVDGSYRLRATAWDTSNNTNLPYMDTYIKINNSAPLDTTPPTVSWRQPAAGSTVSGVIYAVVDATDDVRVLSSRFFVDDKRVSWEDTESPYTATWNTSEFADGQHTIRFEIMDWQGNIANTVMNVTVSNTADTIPPVLHSISPADGQTVSGTTPIRVETTDNVGIRRVYFYIDTSNVLVDEQSPYEYIWNTGNVVNGAHTVQIDVSDVARNVVSKTITLHVNNAGDSTPPVLTLSPVEGSVLPSKGSVTVSAQANDISGLASIQLQIDGKVVKACNGVTSCTYKWSMGKVAAGQHTIKAVATDNSALRNTATVTSVVTK